MQGEVAPPKTAALGKRERSLSDSFRPPTQLLGPQLLAAKSELQAVFAFPRSGRAGRARDPWFGDNRRRYKRLDPTGALGASHRTGSWFGFAQNFGDL